MMAVLLEACYLQMTLSVLQRLINVVSKRDLGIGGNKIIEV